MTDMLDLFASDGDDDFGDSAFGLRDGEDLDDLTDVPVDIFGGLLVKEEPKEELKVELKAEPACSPGADCTDAASERDSGGSIASASPLVSPDESREAKAARRIARKNRARLHRYHRSKAELVGLRREVVQLQQLLEKLRTQVCSNRVCDVEMLLCSAPSPFAGGEDDELDPRECAMPKARREVSSGTSAVSWKDAATTELRQRRRAEAVQRKLVRILNEYAQRCDLFQRAWVGASTSEPGRLPLYRAPQVPGMGSMSAFTHNGVVVLRELYHMACGACGVQSIRSSMPPDGFNGGSLAYSLFLGPGIELGWENECTLPGGDPQQILSLYLRALSTQPPDQEVVKATHKTHASENELHERAIVLRVPRARSVLDLEGVKLTQIYTADDHVVVVMSLAVNIAENDSAPLFRSSGWMVVTKSEDMHGAPCCLVRSCTRVHCATPGMLSHVDEATPRSAFVSLWKDKMQMKAQAIQTRLQLVMT